ncbi:MAG: sialate O-acetylesterase [Ferruginibacter sp.]
MMIQSVYLPKRIRKFPFLILFFCLPMLTFANIVLPNIFNDNMVLQRNTTVKIWGWGSSGEEVTITTGWDNKTYKTKTDNQANWNIEIQTPAAGGPYTLNFKGYNEITLNNVMLGEVWLCSGQSNMEYTPAAGIVNGDAEITKANYPNIRFFTVPKISAKSEQINLPGQWQTCTPESMKYFTAVGYFFAQHLQEDLKAVPIGIINSSWGGTPAEIWFPAAYIAKDPVLSTAAAKLTPVQWGPTEPGRTWNAMINPLVGFKIAGALWYQGESNVGSNVYDKTLGGLITSWRQAWGDEFPFYFVQIAPYKYGGNNIGGAVIRDAQRKLLNEISKTAMVVISDISTPDNIHPKDKKPVGNRLANLALNNIYGINKGIVNGPLYKEIKVKDNKATVYFDNAAGLHFKAAPSTLFEIAGADGIYHTATAKIVNETVVLTSKDVQKPTAVRFAWHDSDQADLFNSAMLPASSFISESD